MRFAQVALFCRVYEDGTVSAAAAAMLISQPAASLQLRELERELGSALFVRRGRRLVPTAAGELFYGYATSLTSVWEEAEQAVTALREGRAGTVMLGASTTGVMYHLPPLLRAFARVAPGVSVTLACETTDRVCGWLLRHRVDVGLVWGPVQVAGLIAQPLLHSRFALILPAGHPAAAGTLTDARLDAGRLAGVPFVLQEAGSSTRAFVDQALRNAGIEPVCAMALRSTEEVKAAVEAGLGAAVVAARAVQREVDAGVLDRRAIEGCDLGRPIMLVTRNEAEQVPAVSAFVRFAQGEGAAHLA